MATAAEARKYRSTHPEKVKATALRYRMAHRAEAAAKTLRWRIENPIRAREMAQTYARRMGSELSKRRRDKKHLYYLANKAKMNAASKAWREANPELAHHYEATHRTKQKGNGGTHTVQQWLAKRALFGECCFYCGFERKLERDHIVPLSRGGSNDIKNIIPACRSCNARKHAKTAHEFIALKGAA